VKIILKEHVEGVGHLGDVLDVKDGFARNFLLPRKKAIEASERNVKEFEHHKRVMAGKAQKEKLEIETFAKKLSAVSLTITAKAGKDNKLFGSVTTKDIEERLTEQGFTIDRRKIQLDQPIKTLGTVAVPIKLHRDITATVSLEVVKNQEDEAPAEETEKSAEKKPRHKKAKDAKDE